jgi:GH35 family endo-1,4-beta-xylanase
VDLAITELDIRMTLPATDPLLAQQKQDYHTIIYTCGQIPKCVEMTIWGYSDYYSWITVAYPGQVSRRPLMMPVHGRASSNADFSYRALLFHGTINWCPSRLSTESWKL